ncbi:MULTISPECIES: hypothetical protein [unclassified Streptomyces]
MSPPTSKTYAVAPRDPANSRPPEELNSPAVAAARSTAARLTRSRTE